MASEAAGRDFPADVDQSPPGVEEHEVQREAHPDCVDGATARYQEPPARSLTRDQRETEEAAEWRGRNGNDHARDFDPLEVTESDRLGHPTLRVPKPLLAPLSRSISLARQNS
jgi:hypothetical protein